MKIIERAVMPNGTKILLEKWDDGFMIGAYPIAKNNSKYRFINKGENFRLTISNNKYINYTNENVKEDFEALKNGNKTLEDLSKHFWNGRKDMFYLGMIEEHEIEVYL